ILFSILTISASAQASPLVADLSNYHIAMDSSFNGTRMFLFGTRNDNGDIVVVVRGEKRNYIVRKKEKIAGMWVNHDRMKFYGVPNFYAIASSKPLSDIYQSVLFSKLGIGENNLFSPPNDISKTEKFNEFSTAFLAFQRANRIYTTNKDNIGFIGETLFKTVIEFSDNIPPGKYTAEIYLISDGEVVGMQSTPIQVVKSGLDAFIYDYAHKSPALYGLSAIVLALSAGWFAGRLFEVRA
ncbi:MAG: TIGR02186 family protein, partial [Rickettsiales bacterium]